MDFYKSLQVKALRSILHPDNEAFLRHVKRFVSKNFNIPLDKIDDLDEEFLLTTYYEEAFEQASEEDREDLLNQLTETEEEQKQRERSEQDIEAKDTEFLDTLNKEVQAGSLKGPPKKTPKYIPKAKPIKTTPKVPPPELPLDIHMDFGEGNLLPDDWANLDPLNHTKKK